MPETSLSLYEIDETISQLVVMWEEVSTDEERAAIDGQIVEWVGQLKKKEDACYGYIRHEEQMAAIAKDFARHAVMKQHTHENRVLRVRDVVKRVMERDGLRHAEGAVGSFTLRTSGGPRPLLPVDETLLPDEYKRVQLSMPLEQWHRLQMMVGDKTLVESLDSIKVVVDTVELRAALDAGKDVPGAKLGDRGTSLMMR